MYAHRVKTRLTQDGIVTLDKLPFQSGDVVEIIILALTPQKSEDNLYPLRGTPIEYKDPLEPVAEADWDVLP